MEKVRIQDDLYEHVNGEWLASAVIPDDKPTTGGFSLLADDVEKKMMEDFESFKNKEKTSDILGVSDAIKLYEKVLDENRRNEDGINPILPLLNEIKELKSVEDLNSKAKKLSVMGMPLPYEFGVEADMKDATKNSLVLLGPSIILPDTTYYGSEAGDKLLAVYADMAKKALAYTDLDEETVNKYVEDTLAFDKLVSAKVKSQLEWADYVNNYNPMSTDEVHNYLLPNDFKGLLNEFYKDETPKEVVVYDPKAIKEMNGYFNNETFNLYVHWAYVKTLLANTQYLSLDLAKIGTTYRRTLIGVPSDPVLTKQAYQVASSVYAEPIGVYYGRTYFGEEAKKDVVDLVKKIIETYKRRVKENKFLEEKTKEKAILKLSTIGIKMGYPDDVKEIYKQLTVKDEDSYFDTMKKISEVKIMHNLEKLNKPVDKTEWQMPGHMVNACYDPSRNDITFPAAILQKPFYSLNQTVSENLGGIGCVVAHEVSHAFDNNGAHFDENGNLFNWWSENDFKEFDKLTKDMVEQWDKIPYAEGEVNGQLVVSENIADNGGMAVALDIMAHTENRDYKLFFTNWAKVWCMKAKLEYMQLLLKNDVHSPAKLRANIQVRNFKEWYETFDVIETDQMYIPEEKRIIIW